MTVTARTSTIEESRPERELVDHLVTSAGIHPRRRPALTRAVSTAVAGPHRPTLGAVTGGDGSPSRVGSLAVHLVVLGTSHIALYACFLAAWAAAGRAGLAGRFAASDALAFGAAGAGLLAARWVSVRAGAATAAAAGARLKHRTLRGSLSLETDEVHRRGAGDLLGVTLEADALESLAVHGGEAGLLAATELAAAAAVLATGVAPGPLLAALGAWLLVTAALAVRYRRLRLAWTAERLELTANLVEQLVGHRTRLAQGRSDDHDADLEPYASASRRLDRNAIAMLAVVPRGWLLVGLAGVATHLDGPDRTGALVATGGVLLAWHGLDRLALALTQLLDAGVAWSAVAPLLHPRSWRRPPEVPVETGDAVVEADALRFEHPGRPPALLHASVRLDRGERVVLAGESGAGKSTLASLLAGLRHPSDGVVRRNGRVVLVPQYHENHVLSASLAFNLLIGRGWPPSPGDLQDVTEMCRDLGLGPLLDEMPGGLNQPVGECGWQLSQGEQSRLFIARALLQRPDVLILDESLAALDPEAVLAVVDAVTARVPTVLVVAHP